MMITSPACAAKKARYTRSTEDSASKPRSSPTQSTSQTSPGSKNISLIFFELGSKEENFQLRRETRRGLQPHRCLQSWKQVNRWPLNLTLNKQETNTPVYVYHRSLFDACLQETNMFYSHRGKITSKKPDLH